MRSCSGPHMCGPAERRMRRSEAGRMRPGSDRCMHPSDDDESIATSSDRCQISNAESSDQTNTASQDDCRTDCMSDSIERLAFELGIDALKEQERALVELRNRAAAVLATGSVVASLTASRGTGMASAVPGLLGMSAFVLALGGAILIMLPRGFVFSLDGTATLEQLGRRDCCDVAIAYREAGRSLAGYGRENAARLGLLATWLTASCLLLLLEVVCLTVNELS